RGRGSRVARRRRSPPGPGGYTGAATARRRWWWRLPLAAACGHRSGRPTPRGRSYGVPPSIASLWPSLSENLLGEGVRVEFPIPILSQPPSHRSVAVEHPPSLVAGSRGDQRDDLLLEPLLAAGGQRAALRQIRLVREDRVTERLDYFYLACFGSHDSCALLV